MSEVLKLIDVDLYNPKYIVVHAKQYDKNARKIIITCYSDGTPMRISANEYAAFIRYKKPDDRIVFNDCAIKDGKIELDLTEQMLMADGRAYGEIVLIAKENINYAYVVNGDYDGYINKYNVDIFSTMPFVVNVIPATYENSEAESTDEYNAFYNLVSKMLRDYLLILKETNYMQTPVRKINGKTPDDDGNFAFESTDWQPIIDKALLNAKNSGMFDGKTPQKFVDYFTAADFAAAKLVKTVNGIAPDSSGDISISLPEFSIPNNSITTAKILNGAVTNDKLAGNISSSKLAGGITNDKLAGGITNDKLSSGIDGSKITQGTIDGAQIKAGAVTSAVTSVRVDHTNWGTSNGYYTKTVAVSGVSGSQNIVIDLDINVSSVSFTPAAAKNMMIAWSSVAKINLGSNSITIYAIEQPAVDLYLKVLLLKR